MRVLGDKTLNGSGPFVRRLYKKFYISTVITIFLRNSSFFISSFLAGNMLGPDALGIVGLLIPFSFFYIALGSLYEVGCAALCSKHIGNNDFAGAKKIVTAAYAGNFLVCAAVAVPGFLFLDNILTALKIPVEAHDGARAYAAVFMVCGFFISSVFIGYALLKFDGYLKTLTAVTAITPLCAFGITYALVKWAGAGLFAIAAGACTSYVAICIAMLCLTAFKAKVLGFARVNAIELIRISLRVFKNGLTGATGEVCSIINGVIINAMLVTNYGHLALSSFTAYCSLFSLYVAATLGSSVASVQLAGVMNAERDSAGVKCIVNTSLAYGLSMTAAISIGNVVFTGPISAGFGLGSPEALAVMKPVMFALSLCAIFDVFTNTFIHIYNTLGRHMASTMLSIGRRMVFLVIPAYLLSGMMGAEGVWHSLWLCSALTSGAAVLYSLVAARHFPNLSKPFLINDEAERMGMAASFSIMGETGCIDGNSRNVADFCMSNGIEQTQAGLIALMIKDTLSLIRIHGLKGRTAMLNVRILFIDGGIVIRFRYAGDEYNPFACYAGPNLSENAGPNPSEITELNLSVSPAKSVDHRLTFGVNCLSITIDL